ncbi:MAG: hypothetical protein EPO68_10785 [Planctomycetota bacterium]|nr:MAG: hypothetical protein EPO68_10785 [Planctomycetota bacterium]
MARTRSIQALALSHALAAAALSSATLAQFAREDQLVVPSASLVADEFGGEIAVDGARMIVGACGLPSAAPGLATEPNAFVYERAADGSWIESAVFSPPPTQSLVTAADPVALAEDFAFVQRAGGLGALYVHRRSALGAWPLVQTIDAAAVISASEFRAQRDLLAVGLPYLTTPATGAIQIYKRTLQGEYLPEALVTAPWAHFGRELDLDGDRLVALADTGKVFVFERSPVGFWSLAATVAIPITQLPMDVALSGDRFVVLAESPQTVARVYERDAGGTWTEQQVIEPATGWADTFGVGLDLRGDWLAVGAYTMNQPGTTFFAVGGAYLYRRAASGQWQQVVRVTSSDAVVSNGIGEGVALGDDYVAVGGGFGSGTKGSVLTADIGTLFHTAPEISTAAGGSQDLLLRAGPAHAGEIWVMVGSISGTNPGTAVPGTSLTLPLVLDAYSSAILAGGAPLSKVIGVLTPLGIGQSTLALPAGVAAALAGTVVHHAYVALDANGAFTHASNAAALRLAP